MPLLDLMICIKEGQLHSKLYTKPTDNTHSSELIFRTSTQSEEIYNLFTVCKIQEIHSESLYLLEAQLRVYSHFLWRDYPHYLIQQAQKQSKKIFRK